MRENKRKIGSEHEKTAVEYLIEHDYEIIEQNFYCRNGEIDIIAKNEGYLVFVEVKYRKSDKYGIPQEAVSLAKQKRIIDSSRYFCLKNKISPYYPVRYDIVAILGENIELIKNAFELN